MSRTFPARSLVRLPETEKKRDDGKIRCHGRRSAARIRLVVLFCWPLVHAFPGLRSPLLHAPARERKKKGGLLSGVNTEPLLVTPSAFCPPRSLSSAALLRANLDTLRGHVRRKREREGNTSIPAGMHRDKRRGHVYTRETPTTIPHPPCAPPPARSIPSLVRNQKRKKKKKTRKPVRPRRQTGPTNEGAHAHARHRTRARERRRPDSRTTQRHPSLRER